jgi:UTP--glucose-1-phosphate uridylyltransferase
MMNKAIIPIAGAGTRLRPATVAVPKALFPLPAGADSMASVLHFICAEAAGAGVREALIVTSPAQQPLVQKYMSAAGAGALPLLPRISYTLQPTAAGFGEAVARGRSFVGRDDFLLFLGDHVYLAADDRFCCAEQVARAHRQMHGAAMIGVQAVGADELARVGICRGEPLAENVYRCADFVEKPSPAEAAARLATPGMQAGTYLAHCGIYAFTEEIFDCLDELASDRRARREEVQLADAQAMLLRRHADGYFLRRIEGTAYDTGTVGNYVKAVAAFAEKNINR